MLIFYGRLPDLCNSFLVNHMVIGVENLYICFISDCIKFNSITQATDFDKKMRQIEPGERLSLPGHYLPIPGIASAELSRYPGSGAASVSNRPQVPITRP
ncbi:hypothetical protein [Marinobacterium maritimum]|uniref:hypothetical protein n=1 Tax=Marinobacterium maritimum TaxID=500162 RepID=UPI0031DC5510